MRRHILDLPATAMVLSLCLAPSAFAQFGGGGAGGIYVDPEGVLRSAPTRKMSAKVAAAAKGDDSALEAAAMRRISLRGLDRAIRGAVQEKKEIPPEVRLLGGLVKIDFVALDPKSHDVFLAGPAEPWRVDGDGREVGTETGRPLLHLEDLVAALRCVCNGPGAVRCSIDPTREGLAQIRNFVPSEEMVRVDPINIRKEVVQKLGLQVVTTGGVPKGSRFALVMIEADYRMKRLAIGLEKFPGVSNHMDVVVSRSMDGKHQQTLARWWFSPRYDAVHTNDDRTVFQFEGQGIELLNEEEMFDQSGQRRGTGKGGDRYSQTFTEQFPKMEQKLAVFADLHNLFDLMLAAGLVEQQRVGPWLEQTAFLDENIYAIPTSSQPTQAEPAINARKHTRREENRRKILVSFAFGGVTMRPSNVLQGERMQVAPTPGKTPKLELPKAKPTGDSSPWWDDLPPDASSKIEPVASKEKSTGDSPKEETETP